MQFEMIFSKEFWVRSLGGDFNNYTQDKMLQMLSIPDTNIVDTIDKGRSIQISGLVFQPLLAPVPFLWEASR